MVFLDSSLGLFGADLHADVIGICPAVRSMLEHDYHEVSVPRVPSHYHVYLRGH
jgi:hypothetical protein